VEREGVKENVLEPVDVLGVERVGPEGVTLRLTVKVQPGPSSGPCSARSTPRSADAFDDAYIPVRAAAPDPSGRAAGGEE
jgi:small conductance mechanosensitive channel